MDRHQSQSALILTNKQPMKRMVNPMVDLFPNNAFLDVHRNPVKDTPFVNETFRTSLDNSCVGVRGFIHNATNQCGEKLFNFGVSPDVLDKYIKKL